MFARDRCYRLSLPDVEPCCCRCGTACRRRPSTRGSPGGKHRYWVMWTPCRYCYRRGLSSYRVMFARVYILSLPCTPVIAGLLSWVMLYTLSQPLSPGAMFPPGSCLPVCTPGQDCYRLELRSHRGHVRPCLHPVSTAIGVGYVLIGVMFARNRCYTIVGHVYALSLLL